MQTSTYQTLSATRSSAANPKWSTRSTAGPSTNSLQNSTSAARTQPNQHCPTIPSLLPLPLPHLPPRSPPSPTPKSNHTYAPKSTISLPSSHPEKSTIFPRRLHSPPPPPARPQQIQSHNPSSRDSTKPSTPLPLRSPPAKTRNHAPRQDTTSPTSGLKTGA